jgi:predicted metal-dependent hydrolase
MDAHLRAGIAIYNAGGYHAAHDAWEDHWLDLDSGTDDEQFLHGLIQFTAAVFHARNRNWSGATGLADSAVPYLDGLPVNYRDVNVGAVRQYLAVLEADPEFIERHRPLELTHHGDALALTDLGFEATAVAAEVLAEERGYDEDLIERAAAYARADIDEAVTSSPFVTLLFDFVREPENRPVVVQRLSEHVQRRESREDDVSGLFERRDLDSNTSDFSE